MRGGLGTARLLSCLDSSAYPVAPVAGFAFNAKFAFALLPWLVCGDRPLEGLDMCVESPPARVALGWSVGVRLAAWLHGGVAASGWQLGRA